MQTKLSKLPRLTSLGVGTRCLHVPWQLIIASRKDSKRIDPKNRHPDRDAGGLPSSLSRGSILVTARRARLGGPQSAEEAASRCSSHRCHSLLAGRVKPCWHSAVKPSLDHRRWKETLRLELRPAGPTPAADSLFARYTGSMLRVS